MSEIENQRLFNLAVIYSIAILQMTFLLLYAFGFMNNIYLLISPLGIPLLLTGLIHSLFYIVTHK